MEFEASFLDQVVQAVCEAGRIIVQNNDKPRSIRYKGRNDLVTDTDIAVEEDLKARLSRLLPESSFLAEETSGSAFLGDLTWVIDPVDGTTNFAHGLPMVATSVGLWSKGQIVLGVVNLPLLGEVFSAALGKGAWMNGESIRVSETRDLDQALIATGFPYAIEENIDEVLAQLRAVLPATRGVRRPGAAALDLAYVACGRYDGFYERGLNSWDTSAGVLLVGEAGGNVSRYDGSPYALGDADIMASNGHVHAGLQELVARGVS
ncbi:inositol monophosphatase family protein [Pseudodesulfovibrio senegalensis]|uniref:Inositol-1-monophosphatase n=1 Tax=Pseudodesulfovibrio senegalensis TaxID=1721087 RepID=A0A6N6N234_9BACT|nr:inositol monophosphatase family protein [Pseudodesulfovibrio senegalensis]KAB1441060.1 inositol monophosphatase [Pseudodesulfovibrio senegalensis]